MKKAGSKCDNSDFDLYKMLFKTAGVGMGFYTVDARIIDYNDLALRFLNMDRSEIVGKHISEVFPKNESDTYINRINAALQSDIALDFEDRVNLSTGTYWFKSNYSKLQNEKNETIGVQIISIDITSQKESEQALLESETKFRSLVNSMPELIYLIDENDSVLFVNDAASYILDKKPDEIIGKSLSQLFKKDVAKQYINDIKLVFKNGRPLNKEIFTEIAGKKLWIYVSLAPVMLNGKTTAVVGVTRDITEQKEAEQELHNRNNYIQRILDDFPIGIATNEIDSQKVLYINPKFAEIYGWPPEDFPTTLDFFNKVFPDKEYREMLQTRIMADIESGDPNRMHWDNLEITTKSGEKRIVYAFNIAMPEQNIMVSTVQDVTERKKAEKALKESEEKLSNVIDHSHELHYIHDKNHVLEYVSKQCLAYFGYTEEEMKVNWTSFATNNPMNAKAVEYTQKGLSTGEKQPTYLAELKRKDGSAFLAEVNESPFKDENGNVIGMVGSLRDVTDKIRAMEALKKEKEHAEESDRLKSAFLANMSHEIRTPMNGILGFTEILTETNYSPEESQNYLTIIKNNGERLLSTINDIIDISRIESGQVELNFTNCNINNLIDELCSFFEPQLKQKGLFLSPSKALGDDYAFITTDCHKLYGIFTNLVKNAMKFTQQGGITIGYDKRVNEIEFFVKDTGIGIPKDKQHLIFERFVQGDTNITRPYEGSGLGLSISKSYIELLGGRIWVKSNEQSGSIFYFTLPYKKVQHIDRSSDKLKESDPDGQIDTELKILIVDDEESVRLHINEILSKKFKNLIVAKTGKEAISVFNDNRDIQVILMDIRMPEIDGYMATKEIRKISKDVYIIAQTAYALEGDREKAIEAGCNDYITKPIKKETLLKAVNRYYQ